MPLIGALLLATPVAAHEPPPATDARAQQPSMAPPASEPPAADLGVSLSRIRKQLRESPATAPKGALRYDFHVDVMGKEPSVDFFKNFDLRTKGDVPYGSPTHQEIINAVTPYGFRTYGGFNVLGRKKK